MVRQSKDEKLRAYIRDLRGDPAEGGYTQTEVALALRITQEHFSMLETGERPWRLAHLVQLAKFYRKPLKSFLDLYDVADNEHVLAGQMGLTTAGARR